MDQRIESFLADVLALAGDAPDAIREGVRVALADCGAIFRAQEVNKRNEGKGCSRLPRLQLCARLLSELSGFAAQTPPSGWALWGSVRLRAACDRERGSDGWSCAYSVHWVCPNPLLQLGTGLSPGQQHTWSHQPDLLKFRSAKRELLAGNPQGPRWLQCGLLYCGIRQPSLFITEIDQRAMEAPDLSDLASSLMGCGDGQAAQKIFYVEQ